MQTPAEQPDVWAQLFEQTPVALRWVLGVLTLGLFTLAGVLWRWNRADLIRVEGQVHSRMDELQKQMQDGFSKVNDHLIALARKE